MNRRTFVLAATGLVVTSRAHAAPRGLRSAVRGEVILPGSPRYRTARKLYNTALGPPAPACRRPPADARDVQALVQWANRRDVALVPRSGGHAFNGSSSSDTAIVVDLSRLSEVQPGPIARIGPGVRLRDATNQLAARGRGWACGNCGGVGAGGLITGGGMGFSMRRHGLALDNVAAVDIVTADGRLRRGVHDGDLFWAVRGGGGNFGIVTRFYVRTFPVDVVPWFILWWRPAAAPAVLELYDRVSVEAPREISSALTMRSDLVLFSGQTFGSEAGLRRFLAPFLAIPGGHLQGGTDPWADVYRRWYACAEGPASSCRPRASFVASSTYLEEPLTAAGRRDLLAASPHVDVLLNAHGGAVADVAPDATAWVHRRARQSVSMLAYAPVAEAAAAVRYAHALIAPHGNGEAYQNYADPSLKGYERAWYGSNLPRLLELKRRFDPDRRFAIRQGL